MSWMISRCAWMMLLLLVCACSSMDSSVTTGSEALPDEVQARSGPPLSLLVQSRETSLPRGFTTTLQAIGTFADGTRADLTDRVTWVSQNPGRASVSSAGLVTGLRVGPVTVRAQSRGVRATISLQVTPATLSVLEVTPSSGRLPVGISERFRATGTFSDATVRDLTAEVAWSVSRPEIATVGSQGIVTGVSEGRTHVTARLGARSASTELLVNDARAIHLTESLNKGRFTGQELRPGWSQRLRFWAYFDDGTFHDVTSALNWQSADPVRLSVTPDGVVTGHVAGPGMIAVTGSLHGKTVFRTFTVRERNPAPMVISPPDPLQKGASAQLIAISGGLDRTDEVLWSSSDPDVIRVSPEGVVTAVAPGTATVRADFFRQGASIQVVCSPATLTGLSITPSEAVFHQDTEQRLKATGTYSDGSSRDLTELVTWSSDLPEIVSVSNGPESRGKTRGHRGGLASIVCRWQGVTSAVVSVEVATLERLEVRPALSLTAPRTTRALRAYGQFSDGGWSDLSDRVTWESSDPGLLEVDGEGNAQALGAVGQQATVTARHPELAEGATASTRFGAYVYLTRPQADAVQLCEPATLAPVGSAVPCGDEPGAALVDPSGRYLFVLARDQVQSFRIEPVTGALTLVTTVASPGTSREMAVQPYGDLLFLTTGSTGTVSVMRIGAEGSLTALGSVPGPTGCRAPFTSPNGRTLFVSGIPSQEVGWRIDAATGTLTEFERSSNSEGTGLTASSPHGLVYSKSATSASATSASTMVFLPDGTYLPLLAEFSRFIDDWPAAPTAPAQGRNGLGPTFTVIGDISWGTPTPSPSPSPNAATVEYLYLMPDRLSRFFALVASSTSASSVTYTVASSSLPARPTAIVQDAWAERAFVALTGRSDVAVFPVTQTGLGARALMDTGSVVGGIAFTP